jgi:hypothetical protein
MSENRIGADERVPGLGQRQSLTVRVNNEWMRRYIEEPERYAREWQSVVEFKADESEGREPEYGERCEAYERQLRRELLTRDARVFFGNENPTDAQLGEMAREQIALLI